MKQAVIIGAGQTGRGFIAPFLQDAGVHITFLDKNPELIQQLQEEQRYVVHTFGHKKPDVMIQNYEAYDITAPQAMEALLQAEAVFTSVFAGNIKDLVEVLSKAAVMRKDQMQVICCENGIHVKKPLEDAKVPAILSEGIIFCTSLQPEKTQLDIISEDYPELPIDGSVENLTLHIPGLPLVQDFPSLIQRKIYTYNFMSAVCAYLGSYGNYEVYGEAANDPVIAQVMEGVKQPLSHCIALEYGVSDEEQMQFTQRAIDKFQNKEIYDTIYRNARQAKRKLQKQERLQEPLRMLLKYKEDASMVLLVMAAALYYGVSKEGMEDTTYITQIRNVYGEACAVTLERLYQIFCEKKSLADIYPEAVKQS